MTAINVSLLTLNLILDSTFHLYLISDLDDLFCGPVQLQVSLFLFMDLYRISSSKVLNKYFVLRIRIYLKLFEPWVGKIPWKRKWQSTPGLLPGKSHGRRSLVGYSLWSCNESDTTEQLHFTSLHFTLVNKCIIPDN